MMSYAHGVFDDDFTTRLRALELSAERVKDHWTNGDSDLAVIDAANALNAVYDLHEAYFHHAGIRDMSRQDDHLAEHSGEVVGALALARGARAHHLVAFVGSAGFGQLPFGRGPFGGGYIWTAHSWQNAKFARRSQWYAAHVQWRALWQPFDEAWGWFVERSPERGT